MATWQELKQDLHSIATEQMQKIDGLAYLHAQKVKRGISQAEMAQRIGMKQSQLAKMETMSSTTSLNGLDRYANGLGLEMVISFKPMATA